MINDSGIGKDAKVGITTEISPSSKACSVITINGGNVKATGGENGAGIGNGSKADAGGKINITGGTVSATGGYEGAGIGRS